MIRLILVRHGQTRWNEDRRLQGQQDIGLSAAGRVQVAALRPSVARLAPERTVTSGLRRARETAEALGFATHHCDPRLNEAFLGEWEGRSSADLRAEDARQYADWRAGRYRPPGAEDFAALTSRVLDGIHAAVADAAEAGAGTVLVVVHGGPVRAFLQATVGLDPARTVPSHPASLSLVDVDPDAPCLRDPGAVRLRLFNYSPALSPLDPPD